MGCRGAAGVGATWLGVGPPSGRGHGRVRRMEAGWAAQGALHGPALSHMPGRRGFRVWGNSGTGPPGLPRVHPNGGTVPGGGLKTRRTPSLSGRSGSSCQCTCLCVAVLPWFVTGHTLSGVCVCSPPQPFWLSLSSQNQAGPPQLGNPRTTSFGSMAQGL